jgi:hypothetical protein
MRLFDRVFSRDSDVTGYEKYRRVIVFATIAAYAAVLILMMALCMAKT